MTNSELDWAQDSGRTGEEIDRLAEDGASGEWSPKENGEEESDNICSILEFNTVFLGHGWKSVVTYSIAEMHLKSWCATHLHWLQVSDYKISNISGFLG